MGPVRDLTKEELLTWTGGHPHVECEVDPALVRAKGVRLPSGWAALVLRPTRTHGTPVDVLGDASAPMVALLREPSVRSWLDEHAVTGATVVREHSVPVVEALGGDPSAWTDWEWLVTAAPPPPPSAAASAVVELDGDRRDEITDFLAEHNPRTDGRPFAWPGQLWLGVRDQRGALLGVGCRDRTAAGYPRLTGIATATQHRGQGVGRAITAALTRHALREAPMCTIELYSDNAVARRLYRDLGYGRTVEWRSGPLPSAPEEDDP